MDIFSKHPTENVHRAAGTQQCSHHYSPQRCPPHCDTIIFIMSIIPANLLPAGMGGVPTAVSPACRRLEQHPLPTGCLCLLAGTSKSLLFTGQRLLCSSMWEHNQEHVVTPRGFPKSLFPSYSQS